MSEFEFTAQINTSFINPVLEDKEFSFIAEYDYFPAEKGAIEDGLQLSPDVEEEIVINAIRSKSNDHLEIFMASYIWEANEFDHLIDDIFASRNAR